MDPSVSANTVTRLFTFGYGQYCPFTGKDLGDHYALVTAPDRSSALLLMNAAFGRNWAFEYDPASPNIVDYIPRMTLHAHLNLNPQQPMPPGFEYVRKGDPTGLTYGRGDEGTDPQPVAGRSPAHVGAMTEVGLVDETEAPSTGLVYAANQARQAEADAEPGACAECGGAVKVVDNHLVHVNEVGGRLLLESHDAWVEA